MTANSLPDFDTLNHFYKIIRSSTLLPTEAAKSVAIFRALSQYQEGDAHGNSGHVKELEEIAATIRVRSDALIRDVDALLKNSSSRHEHLNVLQARQEWLLTMVHLLRSGAQDAVRDKPKPEAFKRVRVCAQALLENRQELYDAGRKLDIIKVGLALTGPAKDTAPADAQYDTDNSFHRIVFADNLTRRGKIAAIAENFAFNAEELLAVNKAYVEEFMTFAATVHKRISHLLEESATMGRIGGMLYINVSAEKAQALVNEYETLKEINKMLLEGSRIAHTSNLGVNCDEKDYKDALKAILAETVEYVDHAERDESDLMINNLTTSFLRNGFGGLPDYEVAYRARIATPRTTFPSQRF